MSPIVVCALAFFILAPNNSKANDGCLRTGDDIIATIYSAADQALGRGICTSRDVSDRFNRIERMISEITTSTSNEINRFITTADSQFRMYQKTVADLQDNINTLTADLNQVQTALRENTKWVRYVQLDNGEVVPRVYGTDILQEVDQEYKPTYVAAGNLVRKLNPVIDDGRAYEINRYNNSIASLRGKRVYRYYWSIPDVNRMLWASPQGSSIRSPTFNIFNNGYRMYIRIHPRQPTSSSVSLSVGIAPGENDQILDWPFQLKHYISVLDRSVMRKDINSKLLNPTKVCSYWSWMQPAPGQDNLGCTAMTFSSSRLLSNSYAYVENDVMLVRITVYLDN
ncbi:unnamed protein product [Cyprideis torosa]|uniref:Uncharacterized protein n=1 Tax=Cyprideis torosa TaxID=163714 RepID=A0A7R8ZQ96_9CRUS|nr:unnamed protein product [Cyprideis torosa]CAG0895787.1 unnamed protein product [Cyprideis torosa]